MKGLGWLRWSNLNVPTRPVRLRPVFPRDLVEAQALVLHNLPLDGQVEINADGLIVVDTIAIDPDGDLFKQAIWPWFKRLLELGWTPGFAHVVVDDQHFIRVFGPLGVPSEVERGRE